MTKKINTKFNILLFICCLSVFFSCGKKADPMPYGSINVKKIKDLKIEKKSEGFLLSWSLPKGEKIHIDYLILKRAKRLLNDTTCLVKYEILKELDREKQNYLDTEIEKGFFYTYKIKIRRRSGALSKDSNIVTEVNY